MTFLTELVEGLRIALRAIGANKLRALLTTLGIIIGIVSVTATFTTINGIERGFDRSMEMIGTDALFVQRFPWFAMGDWWDYRNRRPIEEDVIPVIRRHVPSAAAVAPVTGTMQAIERRGQRLGGLYIEGSTAEYPETGGVELSAGRFYTEPEVRGARHVAVLGADVVDELFPVEDPVGKQLRIGGERFTVIGVTARRGKFLGLASVDNRAAIPLTTLEKLFGRQRDVAVKVRVAEAASMDEAEDELVGAMRLARGLDPMEKDDFSINRQEMFRQQIGGVKGAIYGVGLFLTGLALLVGGIGVMNIMFVSVRERTREIGIRKAVGATRRAILAQFLIEAVVVCLIGGLIGVGIAAGVTALINQVFTAVLSPAIVLLAFGICVGVGVVFGFVPAWRAASSRPIEALRYE